MPSAALDFRHRCGNFLWIFIQFMNKRCKLKKAMTLRVLKVKNRLAGVMVGLVLTTFFYGDLLLRCGDIESNPGPPKLNLRQTRIASSGSGRRESTEQPGSESSTTPPELTLQDVMRTLSDMRQETNAQLEDLKKDFKELRQDCATLHSELRTLKDDVTELRKENDDLKKANIDLAGKLEDHERRMDDLEGRSKRNNLIFYGLTRREGETSADCEGMVLDLLTDKLDINDRIELDRVHRLNARPDSPVIARCAFYRQKIQILKSKGKLKGTDIFIGEDFSKGVREIRRKLTPHLKKARQEGKRATMVFNHLLIDGKKFSVDTNDRLIELR